LCDVASTIPAENFTTIVKEDLDGSNATNTAQNVAISGFRHNTTTADDDPKCDENEEREITHENVQDEKETYTPSLKCFGPCGGKLCKERQYWCPCSNNSNEFVKCSNIVGELCQQSHGGFCRICIIAGGTASRRYILSYYCFISIPKYF